METTFIGVILPWLVAFFIVVLIILQTWGIIANIRKYLHKISSFALITLLVIVILGSYIRFAHVPNTHRIYYDEDRYLGYAVSFAKFNKAFSIELATSSTHYIGYPDQAIRLTVPVLHGLIIKFIGSSTQYLFTTSKIVSILSIFSIFILSKLLFRSNAVSLLSSALMAFLPIQAYWSTSLALDPYFVFFTISALASTLISAIRSTRLNHIVTSIWVFLLLCVRLESFILLPLFAYFFYHARKERGLSLYTKTDSVFFLFLAPLILIRALASISVLGTKWCCAAALPLEAFSAKYFIRHILANISYFVFGKELPYFFTIPAFIIVLRKSSKIVLGLGLWVVLFTLFYSFYYAGLFYTPEFSGSYARYYLIVISPLILLFSLAACEMGAYVRSKKGGNILLLFLVFLYAGLMYQNFKDYKILISKAPSSFDQVDVIPIIVRQFLKDEFIAKTPENALLIHPITNVPVMYGRGAVYQEYFFNERRVADFVENYIKMGGLVYIIGSQADYCNDDISNCKNIERFSFKKTQLVKKNPYGFFINQVVLKDATNKK